MPTFDVLERFWRDFDQLTEESKLQFLTARALLSLDLKGGVQPRTSLRVKRVVSHSGIWEMSWAADGRATFEYGAEVIPGQPHIIWRRIGTHDIFRNP